MFRYDPRCDQRVTKMEPDAKKGNGYVPLKDFQPQNAALLVHIGSAVGGIIEECMQQKTGEKGVKFEEKNAHLEGIRQVYEQIAAGKGAAAKKSKDFSQCVVGGEGVCVYVKHTLDDEWNDTHGVYQVVIECTPPTTPAMGVSLFGCVCAHMVEGKAEPLVAMMHMFRGMVASIDRETRVSLVEKNIDFFFPAVVAHLLHANKTAALQAPHMTPKHTPHTHTPLATYLLRSVYASIEEKSMGETHASFETHAHAAAVTQYVCSDNTGVPPIRVRKNGDTETASPETRYISIDLSIGSWLYNVKHADTVGGVWGTLIIDPSINRNLLETHGDGVSCIVPYTRCLEVRPIDFSYRTGETAAKKIDFLEHMQRDGYTKPELETVQLGSDFFAPIEKKIDGGDAVSSVSLEAVSPFDGEVVSVTRNGALARIVVKHTVSLSPETPSPVSFYSIFDHLDAEKLPKISEKSKIQAGAFLGSPGRHGSELPPFIRVSCVLDLFGDGVFACGVSQIGAHQAVSLDPLHLMQKSIGKTPVEFCPSLSKVENSHRSRSADTLARVRQSVLGPNCSLFYRSAPLKIVRGVREYLIDESGRAYLDGVNNVCHVGHCNPSVSGAVSRQMGTLNTNSRFLHDALVSYAERLKSLFPPELCVVFVTCTGSEANELAVRLARAYTQHTDVVVLDGCYHGNTTSLIDICAYDKYGAQLSPWSHTVPTPDGFRGAYKYNDPLAGQKYAENVKRKIDEIRAKGRTVAAFLAESLMSCGGQIIYPPDFFAHTYAHIRAAGGVCIADEVQTGFGRVGAPYWWGFQTQKGALPDIVTLGKPIGNGHPLSAVVTTRAVAEAFKKGEYFNTYGGNPVSCVAGLEVIECIERERLRENAESTGALLKSEIAKLKDKHTLIGDVRGLGLFVGIELVTDRETLTPAAEHAAYVSLRMREHGVLMSTDGPFENILKLKPPMCFSREAAVRLAQILDTVLSETVLSPANVRKHFTRAESAVDMSPVIAPRKQSQDFADMHARAQVSVSTETDMALHLFDGEKILYHKLLAHLHAHTHIHTHTIPPQCLQPLLDNPCLLADCARGTGEKFLDLVEQVKRAVKNNLDKKPERAPPREGVSLDGKWVTPAAAKSLPRAQETASPVPVSILKTAESLQGSKSESPSPTDPAARPFLAPITEIAPTHTRNTHTHTTTAPPATAGAPRMVPKTDTHTHTHTHTRTLFETVGITLLAATVGATVAIALGRR